MASLFQDSTGRWVIQFATGNGKRQSIRLGRINRQAANKLAAGVEQAEDELALLGALSADSLAWMKTHSLELRNKFSAAGLLPRTQSSTVLRVLLSLFKGSFKGEVSTMNFYENVCRNLIDCYGAETPTHDIKDAIKFLQFLKDEDLSPATVARRVRGVKKIWKWAVDNGYADTNPFTVLRATDDPNAARQKHVPAFHALRILEVARPGLDIIIALARFGGLRCPSEIQRLKWSDVDWNAGTITIHSPKLRHHKNHMRVIPIFHDLKPYLRAAFDRADGELVIGSYHAGVSPQMWTKELAGILRSLGIPRWPRLWQNLRASCESDLLDAGFAENVAAKWMGHSVAVQRRHYTPMNDEHYRRAANFGASATLGDTRQGSENIENIREIAIGGALGSRPKVLHGAVNPSKTRRFRSRAVPGGASAVDLCAAYNRVMRRHARRQSRRSGGAK